MMNFHPDHLADLRKSGLTDDTIEQAGIKTVPPGQINKWDDVYDDSFTQRKG